jgi:murein DD-endopeptidase MepM/ murein hydrolase activator NlpD
VIGLNGSTGDSTGAHLHYELRYDGDPWGGVWGDPAKFEMEVFELKVAIVVNALVDILIVEPLAKHLDAPIFLREACGQLNAEKVIVAGGDAKIFERPGAEVVDLSGTDRWETAAKVGEYYRGL